MNIETKGLIAILSIVLAVAITEPLVKKIKGSYSTEAATPSEQEKLYVPSVQEKATLKLEQDNWKMRTKLDSIEKTKPRVVAVMKDGDYQLAKIAINLAGMRWSCEDKLMFKGK